jgi:hypothetical protein
MTHAPHSTQTNRRRARCIECKAHIDPGQGRKVLRSFLCEACAGLREEQDLAYRFLLRDILPVVPEADRWLTRTDLERWVIHAGRTCAMVMQAVADRVDMANAPVGYHQVWSMVREETALLGG